MIIVICGNSAREFWSHCINSEILRKNCLKNRKTVNLPKNYKLCTNKEFITRLATRLGCSLPLQMLAENQASRRNSRLVACVTKPVNLLEGSFIFLGKYPMGSSEEKVSVYIAIPEFCFLQVARTCDFYELIKFGFDLCAMYVTDMDAEYKQKNREPLASRKSLLRYIEKSSKLPGSEAAREALRYVADRSNSPMETKLAMMAALPVRLGGFGLPVPQMNLSIHLNARAAKSFGRSSCMCDLVWDHLVVEYNSNAVHLTINQNNWDSAKRNALQEVGRHLIVVTAGMVSNVYQVERTFLAIRKAMGKRTSIRRLEETREERFRLFSYL